MLKVGLYFGAAGNAMKRNGKYPSVLPNINNVRADTKYQVTPPVKKEAVEMIYKEQIWNREEFDTFIEANNWIMDNNQQVIVLLSKEVNGVRQGHDKNIGQHCASLSSLRHQYSHSSFGSVPHGSDSTTTHSNLTYVTP